MRTAMINGLRQRWLVAGALIMASQGMGVSAGVAEEDHLVGIKVKDGAAPSISGVYDLSNAQYGGNLGGQCALKKPKFLLVQGEKNGGDDPRGGAAGKFLCYKAKCTTGIPPTIFGDDQFSPTHTLDKMKTQLVCAPYVDTTAPRFVDNGDGTVTDTLTRLIWEKKQNLDSIITPADPHDADNYYDWSTGAPYKPTGTTYTDFLYALNGGTSWDGVATTGCFAGHCDWRLPTIQELAGIVDETQGYCGGGSGACIDPIFGTTKANSYWSATSHPYSSDFAWGVSFVDGSSLTGNKGVLSQVRAVRSGS